MGVVFVFFVAVSGNSSATLLLNIKYSLVVWHEAGHTLLSQWSLLLFVHTHKCSLIKQEFLLLYNYIFLKNDQDIAGYFGLVSDNVGTSVLHVNCNISNVL